MESGDPLCSNRGDFPSGGHRGPGGRGVGAEAHERPLDHQQLIDVSYTGLACSVAFRETYDDIYRRKSVFSWQHKGLSTLAGSRECESR